MAQLDREKRIDVYGSPTFTQSPSIGANSFFTFSPSPSDRVSKYLPLDNLFIRNDSSSDIRLILNDQAYRIESGQSVSFDANDLIPFRRYKVVELTGNSIPSGSLTIDVRREGTNADSAARDAKLSSPISDAVKNFTGIDPNKLF